MSCRKHIRWNFSYARVAYLLLLFLCVIPGTLTAIASADPGGIRYNIAATSGSTTIKGDEASESEISPVPEIVVRVGIRGVGELDIVALQQDTILYLPLLELFSFLRINAETSPDFSRLQGFYIAPERTYELDATRRVLKVGTASFTLAPRDMIVAHADFYVSLHILRAAFGIQAHFDPANLYVHLSADEPFPVEKFKELGKVRRIQKRSARPADALVGRDRRLLGGGMLDWKLNALHSSSRGNFGTGVFRTGMEVLGGDFAGTVTLEQNKPVDWERAPWRWRYVAEEAPWFRQAIVGWVSSDLGTRTSLLGGSISSTRVYPRREYTEQEYRGAALPGSIIELYVGNSLLDVIKVDSTEQYTLRLPLVHGGNYFRIREIDVYGVSSNKEVRIDVPYDALLARETEYRVNAGVLRSRSSSAIAEAWGRIGLGSDISAGLGVHTVRHGVATVHPAVFVKGRLVENVWLDGTYMHDAPSTLRASYVNARNFTVRFGFRNMPRHGLYNPGIAQREYRASLSLPLAFMPIRTWLSLNGQQRQSEFWNDRTLYAMLNVGGGPISAVVTTQGNWRSGVGSAGVVNALSVNANLLRGFAISGGTSFDHGLGKFTVARASFRIAITSKWYFDAGWYGNLISGGSQAQAGVSLRLPYFFSESRADYFSASDHWQMQQRLDGTIGWDANTADVLFFNQSWVDRSALTLIPFIDDNASGTYEDGELLLDTPVQAWLDRGQRYRGATDDHTRFVNLDQYDTYRVSLDQAGFVDPVWVPMYREIDVVADPNRFKAVYLPVYLGGEVQGSVMHMAEGVTRPQRGVRVLFHRLDRAQQDVQTNTYLDGSFQYFGLAPGRYSAAPDTVQLAALGYRSEPPQREFTVRSKESGDLVEGIDFVLYRSALPRRDTLGPIVEERVERLPDTAIIVVPPIAQLDTVKTPPTVQPDEEPYERPEIVTRDTAAVAFVPLPFGSSRSIPINLAASGIDSTSLAWIDRLAETVRDLRNYTVVVEGHADNFGSFQENQQRSEQRAQRILQLLTDRGVPRERIQVQSFGSRRPVAPNTSAEGRRRNNRADVKLQGTGAAQPSRPTRQQETPRPPTSEREVDSLVFRPPDVVDPAQGSTAASVVLEIEHDGGALDAASRRNIEGLLRVLREQPRAVLQIEGHSDNFGSMEASQQRSQARADRVLAHVLAQGVSRERVQVRAFGSRRPVASNRTAEGRRQNNRVELRVIVP